MSGGRWNYAGYRIQDGLTAVALDREVERDCPVLSGVLDQLGQVLYRVEHQLDWHYSSDSRIPDMAAFEAEILEALRDAVNRGSGGKTGG